jgi:hypothetical protein
MDLYCSFCISNSILLFFFHVTAGLPEEEKESLKVLHYLLEGHMSAKADVGFVAISNHILDAAKSNRCVLLLRQDPDENEMLCIATGVLFDFREVIRSSRVHDVDFDGEVMGATNFCQRLCRGYVSLFQNISGRNSFVTFFSLRDFIYFLKAVRYNSTIQKATRMYTTSRTIVFALERNFSGVTRDELRFISACFLQFFALKALDQLESYFRHPTVVLRDALQQHRHNEGQHQQRQLIQKPRFK